RSSVTGRKFHVRDDRLLNSATLTLQIAPQDLAHFDLRLVVSTLRICGVGLDAACGDDDRENRDYLHHESTGNLRSCSRERCNLLCHHLPPDRLGAPCSIARL